MTSYYGGPHPGIVATPAQLLEAQHRHHHHHHHHHHEEMFQRQQRHLSLRPDNLTTYRRTADDESAVVEAELYDRDQYYSQQLSPLTHQYYTTQNIKRPDDI